MLSTIEYAPVWIIMAIALALGVGTMIGWRRVATIGEKIGSGADYAQGMSAQMTAAVIGLANYTGMPVSARAVVFSRRDDDRRWRWSATQSCHQHFDNGSLPPASIVLSGVLYWIALKLI